MVALEKKKCHFYAIVHVTELGKTAEYTFPLVACRAPAKSMRASPQVYESQGGGCHISSAQYLQALCLKTAVTSVTGVSLRVLEDSQEQWQ